MKYKIRHAQDFIDFYDSVSKPGAIKYPCEIEVSDGTPRSLPQNNLSFKVYDRIAQHMDRDKLAARCYCKLTYGVPILRRDDEKYEAFCQKGLDKLIYEDKLEAMEFTPVTSLMKKKQKSEYLDDVMDNFTRRNGVAFGDLTNG